jgi:hypothetical protein
MVIPRVSMGFLGLLLLGSISSAFAEEDSTRSVDAKARAAIEACIANIERFQQYVCKYDLTAAKAATFEDALTGKYTSVEGIATGMLARDGEFFTVAIDAEKAMNPKSPIRPGPDGLSVQTSLGFSTTRVFVTDKRSMHYSGSAATIHLEDPGFSGTQVPIHSQRVSYMLKPAPDGFQSVVRSDDKRLSLVLIEHSRPASEKLPMAKQTDEFDRSRNGLRQKSVSSREDPIQPTVLEVLEAKEHDGAWFPTRILWRYRWKSTNDWLVREIRVTELKIGPDSGAQAALKQTLRSGTQVNTAPFIQGGFFTLKSDIEVSPADIEDLIQKCVDRAKTLGME